MRFRCLIAFLAIICSYGLIKPLNSIQRPKYSRSLDFKTDEGTRLNAVAGLPIFASALTVAGVVAFHEAGHFLAAKSQGMKIQSYNVGYGPKVFAFNDSSQTEFALRAIPLGGYVAFPSNVELNDDGDITKELDDPDLLQNRPPLQRAWVISAGVVANIILAFALCTGTALTTGIGSPVYNSGIVVTNTPDVESPGYKAGIRINDVITTINGNKILGSEKTVESFINVIRESKDKPVILEVVRGKSGDTGSGASAQGDQLKISVVPKSSSGGGKGAIGIGINARIDRIVTQKSQNLFEAMTIGATETWRLVSFTFNSFTRSLSTGFVGGEVGGPISVVKAGAQMAENSPQALVGFAATLSVNLAILNALPFPALDGGQLAFVLIELAAGRPVPRNIKDAVTGLAFSFLLLLGASTLIGDLSKLNEPLPIFKSLPRVSSSESVSNLK